MYFDFATESFWKILKDYLLIFGKDQMFKTEFGKNILKISNVFVKYIEDSKYGYGFAIAYVYSRKYKCDKFLKNTNDPRFG